MISQPDNRSSLWFGIVLAFCAWSLFRTATDLRHRNFVETRHSEKLNAPRHINSGGDIDQRLYFHPSADKCPNVNLLQLFRPRSYYGLPSALQTANSTLAAHNDVVAGPNTLHNGRRSNASGDKDSNIVWDLLRAEIESAGEGQKSHKQSTRSRKVLVVVPGLGEARRVNLTLRSLETLRRSAMGDGDSKDGGTFACLVYVYDVEILDEAKGRMQHLCEVVLNVGMWTSHMKSVPPVLNTTGPAALSPMLRLLTDGVTHVAIMMDDMDVADLDLARFVALMDFTGFGVASPAFPNEYYEVMRRRCECVYHRTDFVNIMFAVFTRRVWQCWQSLIDPTENSYGWGMDIALAGLCNTTSGVLDVFDTYHRGSSRIFSTDEASKQMVTWIVNRTNVQREKEKRYRDCVTIHRPKEVFPRCELYWDGTQHSDEKKALAADCDCALKFQQ